MMKEEIKVIQFAGFVSENASYHHGEASLHQLIINMSQNFVSSNNIPMLLPIGQFGTRLEGGDDSASPRYIFTKLNPISRFFFHPHDDPVLEREEEDGLPVQPRFYLPIIPFLLINGSQGQFFFFLLFFFEFFFLIYNNNFFFFFFTFF